jgi:AcrR family transcriptional regulator
LARPVRKRKSRPSNIGPVEINKHGQALGRKGNSTRQRLMDATRELLTSHSPLELTAVSVAKEAGTSSATFYIYFNDVRDVIYHLSLVAGDEMREVHRILEEPWNPEQIEFDHALRAVKAFIAIWDRHRDILRFRNLEADRGDKSFYELRLDSARPIITRLAERILEGYGPGAELTRGDALSDATVLFCAMEGLVATDPIHAREAHMSIDRLARAMARMIAKSIGSHSHVPARERVRNQSAARPTI